MKIPVRIHLGFWLIAALIGFLNSMSLWGTIIWMVVIFVSILVHEFGHALTAKFFGLSPRIELVAFGGATIYQPTQLSRGKEFLIILFGPLFGFGLFILASLLLYYFPLTNKAIVYMLQIFRFVNLFWTMINLFPIFPLDGGQMVRVVCEVISPRKGFRISLYISIVFGVGLAFLCFFSNLYIIGFILLLMIFQNFELLRMTKNMDPMMKQDEMSQDPFFEGKKAFIGGDFEKAKKYLEKCRQDKKGDHFVSATELLAKIYSHEKQSKEAYQILREIEPSLSNDGKCLLYFLSFEEKDYSTTVSYAGDCFRLLKNSQVALIAAKAHAAKGEVRESVEWLMALRKYFHQNLEAIVQDPIFSSIKNEKFFQKSLFSDDHKSSE